LVIRLKKFRVAAVIVVLPVATAPLTRPATYSLLAGGDVIAITGIRFPCKPMIHDNKN